MHIENSFYNTDILKVIPLNIGMLYFFEDVVCVEINEGIHLNLELSKEIFEPINSYYHDKDSVVLLSNRVNDFSIEALDYPKFFKALPKVKLFTVVYYNLNNRYNIEIEKQFIENLPFKGFMSLNDAFSYSNEFISSEHKKLA